MLLIGQFTFSLLFIGHHLGNTYTGTDQNGPNHRIAPDSATVRSCNSWFVPKVKILSSVNILLVSMPCPHVFRVFFTLSFKMVGWLVVFGLTAL